MNDLIIQLSNDHDPTLRLSCSLSNFVNDRWTTTSTDILHSHCSPPCPQLFQIGVVLCRDMKEWYETTKILGDFEHIDLYNKITLRVKKKYRHHLIAHVFSIISYTLLFFFLVISAYFRPNIALYWDVKSWKPSDVMLSCCLGKDDSEELNRSYGPVALIFQFPIWVFPKIVVSQNGWFIMENPII